MALKIQELEKRGMGVLGMNGINMGNDGLESNEYLKMRVNRESKGEKRDKRTRVYEDVRV